MSEPARLARPDLRAYLERLGPSAAPPPLDAAGFAAARQRLAERLAADDQPARPLAVIRDLDFQAGDRRIPLRFYDRRENRAPGPLIVYFHGGGFVFGGIDTHDSLCSALADQLDLPLVSVGYRLAPEHPWPAAPDDCEAAVRWLASSPAESGFTASSLILAGDSAGGCLAAVLAIACRDDPAPLPVIAQLLLYPVVHFDEQQSSPSGFTGMTLGWYRERYRPDPESWRAAPIKAALAGLPPALIATGSLDPLCEHGRSFARALVDAGVTTVYREVEEGIHGFASLRRAVPSYQPELDWIVGATTALIGRG